MKELRARPEVNLNSPFWQPRDAAMAPKPFQKPYPRIRFGANRAASDTCLRALREVRDTEAEMILFTSVDEPAQQMERLVTEVIPRL